MLTNYNIITVSYSCNADSISEKKSQDYVDIIKNLISLNSISILKSFPSIYIITLHHKNLSILEYSKKNYF